MRLCILFSLQLFLDTVNIVVSKDQYEAGFKTAAAKTGLTSKEAADKVRDILYKLYICTY